MTRYRIYLAAPPKVPARTLERLAWGLPPGVDLRALTKAARMPRLESRVLVAATTRRRDFRRIERALVEAGCEVEIHIDTPPRRGALWRSLLPASRGREDEKPPGPREKPPGFLWDQTDDSFRDLLRATWYGRRRLVVLAAGAIVVCGGAFLAVLALDDTDRRALARDARRTVEGLARMAPSELGPLSISESGGGSPATGNGAGRRAAGELPDDDGRGPPDGAAPSETAALPDVNVRRDDGRGPAVGAGLGRAVARAVEWLDRWGVAALSGCVGLALALLADAAVRRRTASGPGGVARRLRRALPVAVGLAMVAVLAWVETQAGAASAAPSASAPPEEAAASPRRAGPSAARPSRPRVTRVPAPIAALSFRAFVDGLPAGGPVCPRDAEPYAAMLCALRARSAQAGEEWGGAPSKGKAGAGETRASGGPVAGGRDGEPTRAGARPVAPAAAEVPSQRRVPVASGEAPPSRLAAAARAGAEVLERSGAREPTIGFVAGFLVGAIGSLAPGVLRRRGPGGGARAGAAVLLLAAAGARGAQAEDAVPSPLAAAVAAKVEQCARAEGIDVTPEDRAAIVESAELLAGGLDLATCAGTADDGPEGGAPPTDGAACVAAVQDLGCDDLVLDVAPELAELPGGPPAPWASTYADAWIAKTLECYAEETGAEAGAEDRERLAGYGDTMARALTPMTAAGGCTVDEPALDACTSWVAARSCAETLDSLAATSGAPGASDAAAEGELDVDAMSDEELDARLAAVASERQGFARTLAGPCADVVVCGAEDVDAMLDAETPDDPNEG